MYIHLVDPSTSMSLEIAIRYPHPRAINKKKRTSPVKCVMQKRNQHSGVDIFFVLIRYHNFNRSAHSDWRMHRGCAVRSVSR